MLLIRKQQTWVFCGFLNLKMLKKPRKFSAETLGQEKVASEHNYVGW